MSVRSRVLSLLYFFIPRDPGPAIGRPARRPAMLNLPSAVPGGPIRSAQPKIVYLVQQGARLWRQPTLLHFSSLRLCVFLDQTQACISCGEPAGLAAKFERDKRSGKQQSIPDAATDDGQWNSHSVVSRSDRPH